MRLGLDFTPVLLLAEGSDGGKGTAELTVFLDVVPVLACWCFVDLWGVGSGAPKSAPKRPAELLELDV